MSRPVDVRFGSLDRQSVRQPASEEPLLCLRGRRRRARQSSPAILAPPWCNTLVQTEYIWHERGYKQQIKEQRKQDGGLGPRGELVGRASGGRRGKRLTLLDLVSPFVERSLGRSAEQALLERDVGIVGEPIKLALLVLALRPLELPALLEGRFGVEDLGPRGLL